MKALSHYCHIMVTSVASYLLTLTIMAPAFSSGELMIRGYLVDEPCTLMVGDENIIVKFDTIIDKYLYLNKKTWSEPFQIRLVDCDLSHGSKVSVSFSGAENGSLPGYLALDAGSTATHVAVGIQDSEGTAIPINTTTSLYPLTEPTTTLNFQGFVEGEPDAIKTRTIGLGPFSATATFTLNYD